MMLRSIRAKEEAATAVNRRSGNAGAMATHRIKRAT
jgi:hypothetical protein